MATSNTTTTNHNDEKDYFDFKWDIVSDPVKKLRDLQKVTNLRNPRKFSIQSPWGNFELSNHCSVLGDLFCLFYHFQSNNIVWETFVLEFEYEYESMGREEFIFIGSLMYSANSMSIFKRFEFSGFSGFSISLTENMPRNALMAKEFILSGITLNENIESIELDPLSALTNADIQHLKKLLRTTKTLKELSLKGTFSRLVDPLLFQSITENKTLEKLELRFREISDLSMSNMILSLKGNPTIRDLTICDDTFGYELNLTAHAIGFLLAFSTTLSSLTLQQAKWKKIVSHWKLEHIFQGLEESRSLKTLEVENVPVSLNRLLSFPNSSLERIYYCQNELTSEILDSVTRMKRRMDPIVLVLSINRTSIQQQYEKLKQMLRTHPELRLHLSPYYNQILHINDQDLLHICNFNWHGRYLLDYAHRNNKRVPSSFWSLVLGKANDKPSILYEFLKSGLVFH